MLWTAERRQELEALWAAGTRPAVIQRLMGITPGSLSGCIVRWNLHRHPKRIHRDPLAAHVIEGRTKYPARVSAEGAALKPGSYQWKIGGRVHKGKWRGMPIFALTLEERATCPRDCALWVNCYGGGMNFAVRMPHGPALERQLWGELTSMQKRYPGGFVVRLHVLGDFYSLGYFELWREALDAFPALRVFGYTARQPGSRIGAAIAELRDEQWDRFAMRTSGALDGPRTMVIDREADKPAGVILCPAQTGKTRSCGTCALCWATKKDIAFLRH